jgi:hypothetical protein
MKPGSTAPSVVVLPFSMGDIYCSVIDACAEIFDLRRAHEWTAALEQWCERQPETIRIAERV